MHTFLKRSSPCKLSTLLLPDDAFQTLCGVYQVIFPIWFLWSTASLSTWLPKTYPPTSCWLLLGSSWDPIMGVGLNHDHLTGWLNASIFCWLTRLFIPGDDHPGYSVGTEIHSPPLCVLRAMVYTLANVISACPFLRLTVGTEMYARLHLPYKSIAFIIWRYLLLHPQYCWWGILTSQHVTDVSRFW